MAYVKPCIDTNKFGGESVACMGVDAQKKWSRRDELIIECDPRVSLEAVCEQMGRTPP